MLTKIREALGDGGFAKLRAEFADSGLDALLAETCDAAALEIDPDTFNKKKNVSDFVTYIGSMVLRHGMAPEDKTTLPSFTLVSEKNMALEKEVLDQVANTVLTQTSARQERDMRDKLGASEAGRVVAAGVVGMLSDGQNPSLIYDDDATGPHSVTANLAIKQATRIVIENSLKEAHIVLAEMKAKQEKSACDEPPADDPLWQRIVNAADTVRQSRAVAADVWHRFVAGSFTTVEQVLGNVPDEIRDKRAKRSRANILPQLLAVFCVKSWDGTAHGAVFRALFDDILPVGHAPATKSRPRVRESGDGRASAAAPKKRRMVESESTSEEEMQMSDEVKSEENGTAADDTGDAEAADVVVVGQAVVPSAPEEVVRSAEVSTNQNDTTTNAAHLPNMDAREMRAMLLEPADSTLNPHFASDVLHIMSTNAKRVRKPPRSRD